MFGTLISSVTVGAGGIASIDFNSIPQTPYTDLIVVFSGRSTSQNGTLVWADVQFRPNGATTSITAKSFYGLGDANGSTPDGNITGGSAVGNNATASTFSNVRIYIPNYAGSTNKSWSVDSATENNGTNAVLVAGADVWANTSAITSISLVTVQGSFAQYSTAYLYGLTKGSGGATVS